MATHKAPITIQINKLGPIENSTIEFKPFMLFTGDSSMGKSYAAFLSYYCVYFLSSRAFRDATTSIYDIDTIKEELIANNSFKIRVKISDYVKFFESNASQFLNYLLGYDDLECNFKIQFGIDDFEVLFELEKATNDANAINTKDRLRFSYGGTSLTDNRFSMEELDISLSLGLMINFRNLLLHVGTGFQTLFLPPARAALVGANYSTTESIVSSAGMYEEFLNDMEILSRVNKENFTPVDSISDLLNCLLKGKISSKKGDLSYDSGKYSIPITAAASSIKELAPLFLLLNKFDPSDFSVLFEEPEAHLHPSMQEKVADLLALMAQHGTYFQITTHSDYFMHEINNLIRLHKAKTQNPKAHLSFCVEHKINPEITLDPSVVGAYYFKRRENGSVEVVQQSVENGIPFDTFESTVSNLMPKTSLIEELLEEMGND